MPIAGETARPSQFPSTLSTSHCLLPRVQRAQSPAVGSARVKQTLLGDQACSDRLAAFVANCEVLLMELVHLGFIKEAHEKPHKMLNLSVYIDS